MTEGDSESPQLKRNFKFRAAVRTDIGRKRNENQDAYSAAHSASSSLFIVCDGMGGARGGATASAIAVNVIASMSLTSQGSISELSLRDAIRTANRAIYFKSKHEEDLSGMGTTLVALGFSGAETIVAHVGDSRIYYVRRHSISQLTRDHTLVQELVDSGAIGESEAQHHPIAHMLTRSLGPMPAIEAEIQIFPQTLEPGDRFLLCSDGLYNLVSSDEILAHVSEKSPEDATRALIDLALERGGTDNVTVQIVEVCMHEDESCNVQYPLGSEVVVTLSREVEGGVQELLAKIDSDTPDEVAEKQAPESDRDPQTSDSSASTPEAEAVIPDLSLETSAESNDDFDQAHRELNVLKYAVVAVVTLVLGILSYAWYGKTHRIEVAKQSKSESVQNLNQKIDTTPPIETLEPLEAPGEEMAQTGEPKEVSREELSRELESWVPEEQQVVDIAGVAEGVDVATVENQAGLSKDQIAAILVSEREAPEKAIEELANKEYSIPDAPPKKAVDVLPPVEPATQPIVWENEQKKMERILSPSDGAEDMVPIDSQAPPPANSPELFSDEEIWEFATEKQRIREQIADIDAKIEFLGLTTKSQVSKSLKALKAELDQSTTEVAARKGELNEVTLQLEGWRTLKAGGSERTKLKIADAAAEKNEQVKKVRDEYQKASQEYLDAVDVWQQKPNDLESASRMGALGRVMQQKRLQMDEVLTLVSATELERATGTAAEKRVQLEAAELKRSRIARQIGFLEGSSKTPAALSRDLELSYRQNREELLKKLNELRGKVSDQDEARFRILVAVDKQKAKS